MGSSRTAERVTALVVALSAGLAITGSAVAYADPDPHVAGGSESSSLSVDSTDHQPPTRPSETPPPPTNAPPTNTVPTKTPPTKTPPPSLPVHHSPRAVPSGSSPIPTPHHPLLGNPSTPPATTKTPHPPVPNPAPPAVIPTEPVDDPPRIVNADAPVAVLTVGQTPTVPAPPPLVEPAADPLIMLTSSVGTGTVALTAILIVLITGVWFYGNRLASHLTVRRNHHA